MEKKRVLITGATGGIGEKLVKALLEKDFEVYGQVRSKEKAERIFGTDSKAHFYEVNIEDLRVTTDFLQNMIDNDIHFDLVILAAGQIAKDSAFSSEDEAIAKLEIANYVTTETVLLGLEEVYGEDLKNTVLVAISSQAANFEVGHEFRKDEEGYVCSKKKQSDLIREIIGKGIFKEILLEEPAMIDTEAARSVFTDADTDWTQSTSSLNYADLLVAKAIELLKAT